MNTANKLTILRIILVPVFMALLLAGGSGFQTAALIVFIIASATDAADGYIARHYNQITTFGKFMDPLADKMLTTAAFIIFVSMGRMSPWALALILMREFMVSGIRLLAAANSKVIAASMLGKIKTVSQMAAVIAAIILLNPFFEENSAKLITSILMWISAAATVISGAEYLIKNIQILKD